MPYGRGSRLPGEQASKLGHLDVVKSPFVKGIIDQFDYPDEPVGDGSSAPWVEFNPDLSSPLGAVIAVDGSLQTVSSTDHPVRQLSFVKTALVRLDQRELAKIDKEMPHPVHMRALMRDCALYAATVFPLKNVRVPGETNYNVVRHIIRDSLLIESDGLGHETLKWLAYQKWNVAGRHKSPAFGCPHCSLDTSGLAFDADKGNCDHCGGEVFISDMVGLHLEMSEEAAPESLASSYMNVHETLLLFSVVRHFWEQGDFHSLSNMSVIHESYQPSR